MRIIGRSDERTRLEEINRSGRPEFVVVYGRRRVGKTYLVSQHFGNAFAFKTAGLSKGTSAQQLSAFADDLRASGSDHSGDPSNWIEAFAWLRELLESAAATRDAETHRLIVFIDEMPWFDTPRSGFRTALEHFWNVWASAREDILLIACGSSTSWIVNNLLSSTGGFFDRVTHVIDLQPLTLTECRTYLEWRGIPYSERQVVECYMIFGGIPYYLELQRPGMSLAQNVDGLLFRQGGQLVPEFDRLFRTLFRNPEPYVDVVRLLAGKRAGMTREEVNTGTGLQGRALTKVLKDLELCGFTRGYRDFTKQKKNRIHQLVDPFTLFYLTFVEKKGLESWIGFVGSPAHSAWAGLSFEMVCLAHVDLIKRDLGISGVQTTACAWRSTEADPGAQIDLLIDRRDDVINLCEMKYSEGTYLMSAADEDSVRNKMVAFRTETGTRKAVHPVLVTLDGARHNAHYNSVILREVRVANWLRTDR